MNNKIIANAISEGLQVAAIDAIENEDLTAEDIIQAELNLNNDLALLNESLNAYDTLATTASQLTASIEQLNIEEGETHLTETEMRFFLQKVDAELNNIPNLELTIDVASMESIGEPEFTIVAQEGLKSALKVAVDAVVKLIKKIVTFANNVISSVLDSRKKMAKRAELLKKQAKEFKGTQPKEIKVGGLVTSLQQDGKVASASQIETYTVNHSKNFTPIIDASLKGVTNRVNALKKVVAMVDNVDTYNESIMGHINGQLTVINVMLKAMKSKEVKDSAVSFGDYKVMRTFETLNGKALFYPVLENAKVENEEQLKEAAKYIKSFKVAIADFDSKNTIKEGKDVKTDAMSIASIEKTCDAIIKDVADLKTANTIKTEVDKANKIIDNLATDLLNKVDENGDAKYMVSPTVLVQAIQNISLTSSKIVSLDAMSVKNASAVLSYMALCLKEEKGE